MRFQRVLLITPPIKTELASIRPNIGLGYLAEILLENNICCDVLDMLLGYSLKNLKAKVDTFRPDLLGISLFSNKYKVSYKLIESIKRYWPSMKIVVGGAHVSCLREKVLEECRAIDFGVVLEGEEALLELCRGESLEEIKNLIYRQKDKIISNEVRDFIDDLDSIPFPTYGKFEVNKYVEEKSLVSSRGCPYGCIFCAVGTTIGKKVRLRSPKNVVDEIEYWYKKGYRQFSFQDDNLTLYGERVVKICEEIDSRGLKDLFLRCAGARADKVDILVLTRMKEVGFKTIAFGVEAGNNRLLRVLKKGETIEQIEHSIKNSCDLGYDVYLSFLVGSPTETLSDIEDSTRIALKYPVFHVDFFNIIPYPGTELHRYLSESHCLLKGPEDYLNNDSPHSREPVFETPELSYEERREILLYLKKVEREVFKRRLILLFKRKGLPGLVIRTLSHILSKDRVRKQLLSNIKIRKLADKFRFNNYMKRVEK